MSFKDKMLDLSGKIGVELNDAQIDMFYNYMNLLLEWNEKINLTAITEENDILLKHFIDSITAIKYVEDDEKVVDVGTGAGFPGIPIAILKPNAEIILLDSLNKRINFLNNVINKLNIKNVKTIHSRVEDFAKENREKFDVSISRAVANQATLSEYLLPLVKIGGKAICMKGPDAENEIKEAEYAINILGGKIEKVDNFKLPESDLERNIIIIRKEKNTPKEYPRKAGLPSKEPLKK